MNEAILKLVLMFVMFSLTVIVGLSPLKVLHKLRHEAATAQSSSKHKHVSLVLCLLTCFSGGVFLATCFLHLFPELRENLETLDTVHNFRIDYPVGELLSCLGFFLIFFLEEVVIMIIPSFAHGHGHGHGHDHHHHETTPPLASKSVEASGAGGCCMADTVDEIKKKEDDLVVDETTALTKTTKRAISEEKEGDGHCQTHCPLTVHERRGSNECTANATHTFAPVAFAEPERCETNCEAIDEDPPILMKSRPHAHSHGVRSITFVLALGIHSIIEGLAFGVQSGNDTIIALFLSLMVHKLIVAFSVGLQLFRTHAHQIKWVIISIFTLASMTPLGALIGLAVTSAADNALWKDLTITILQGLAVGTFIYVTFFEVLLHERDNEHPNLLKLLVMFIGFALIGALRGFESSHGHSHSGSTEPHFHGNSSFDDYGH
ncbi:Zinc transporter ZIP3 [Caenorhabditis elegans]|uniref:Zinc transporter ZIP3 n=1 Tax=Caenorhabditis elegans TaxID=6239 RepID=G4SKK4_CAEEL|nr:Zrt (ZRT), Irt- (IRT-) like Protein Transporter [Caenorhabditis elegans]CCD71891.1 Zrt (ZRT), Irt- (IRT-) like Protein Transporter [Caenorhabditis elegans]|eukprot:NP_001249971.1 Zrt (ZRT), Irt-(IRT-) like Protein Transporter [Caenorhabditis elegans]